MPELFFEALGTTVACEVGGPACPPEQTTALLWVRPFGRETRKSLRSLIRCLLVDFHDKAAANPRLGETPHEQQNQRRRIDTLTDNYYL